MFLTFAAGDLALARPVTAHLHAAAGISLDHGLTSEPFATARGEIVRASLLTRLRRCTGALCLYGARTLDDDWVRWTLGTAAELRLPLLGAPLPGEDAADVEAVLRQLGAELVRLDGEGMTAHPEPLVSRHPARAVDAASIAETLRLMRHPLR